jgi:predicted enzyme related to lactoylglutathione lyase
MDGNDPASTTRKLVGILMLWSLAIGFQGSILRADTTFPPFNDPSAEKTIDGKVIWADLFTADVKSATEFYTKTFGWTSEKIKIGDFKYTLMSNFGRPVAGLVHRPRVRGEDAEGLWVAFLSVESISEAIATAKGKGGRVLVEPGVMDGRGSHAIIADPEGSIIGMLKSKSGDPPDFQPIPGDLAWSNLLTRDEDSAASFYQSVFRYDPIQADDIDKVNQYYLISNGYARVGIGALVKDDDAIPGWIHFIRVENLEETLGKALDGGAETLVEPTADLFDGRLAVIADTVGATVGLIEWKKEEEVTK